VPARGAEAATIDLSVADTSVAPNSYVTGRKCVYAAKVEKDLNGNIIEQLVLLDVRIERMEDLLARGGAEDRVIAERERTLQLLAHSRQLLLGALRLA